MEKIFFIYLLLTFISCSGKKTDTDAIRTGIYLDSIIKRDTVEIVPKVVEPADRTTVDTINPDF